MIKVLFICIGNICRSPMAEFVFMDMVKKKGYEDSFYIRSAATSSEEIGNRVHAGTRKILDRLSIDYSQKRAVKLVKDDYNKYDYLICMDEANVKNTLRIVGEDTDNKVCKLLTFAGENRNIADPWYSGDFELTYRDVEKGCSSFFDYLINNGLI